MTEVNNGMDTIDLRDLVERIAELKPTRDAARVTGNIETAGTWTAEDGSVYTEDYDEEQERELRILESLSAQCDMFGRPIEDTGRGLVRGSYFEEYAHQVAIDIGDISRDSSVESYVDWELYAEAVKQDWKPVDFDGEEYWIRG